MSRIINLASHPYSRRLLIAACFCLILFGAWYSLSSPPKAQANPWPEGCQVYFSTANGRYIQADPNTNTVNANSTAIGPSEVFTIENLSGSRAAFKTSNGHYLGAQGGGGPGSYLQATGTSIGVWQSFTIVTIGSGLFAVRITNGTNYFWVAEDGGGGGPSNGAVNVDRTGITGWESFRILEWNGCVPTPSPACSGGAAPVGDWTTANSGAWAIRAFGVSNAASVLFGAWTNAQGSSPVAFYPGSPSGTTWTGNIDLANHPGPGAIHVVAYMSNSLYSFVYCDSADFVRLSTGTINVTSKDNLGNPLNTSWTITCPLTNPACPSYIGTNVNTGTYPSAPASTWTIVPAAKAGYGFTVTPGTSQNFP